MQHSKITRNPWVAPRLRILDLTEEEKQRLFPDHHMLAGKREVAAHER